VQQQEGQTLRRLEVEEHTGVASLSPTLLPEPVVRLPQPLPSFFLLPQLVIGQSQQRIVESPQRGRGIGIDRAPAEALRFRELTGAVMSERKDVPIEPRGFRVRFRALPRLHEELAGIVSVTSQHRQLTDQPQVGFALLKNRPESLPERFHVLAGGARVVR
jgi:hypothetical protein